MTIEEIKALLSGLNFPPRWITDQTVFTIMALTDTVPRQGLLSGHKRLADGARIHDILNFVRTDLGRQVAENTRESYRKNSLRYRREAGWVIRHQLSTNDPNTYYRLHPEFAHLLSLDSGAEREQLIDRLRFSTQRRSRKQLTTDQDIQVEIALEEVFILSPGQHNLLEKLIVEVLAPALLPSPQVMYLGDTAPRVGYQNRTLMRRLNLPIDVSVALPDVIVYGHEEKILIAVEAVLSPAPVTQGRLG